MKVNALRTDNGLEFYNKEFEEYCQRCELLEIRLLNSLFSKIA